MSAMNSAVISIPNEEGASPAKKINRVQSFFSSPLPYISATRSIYDYKRLIHSIKVGAALVLVSLFFALNPLYKQVGENAMWAVMTVVVIFEFYAGAMLSKGLNRGIGTILGGGFGSLAAILAHEVGGSGKALTVGVSVFILGAAATYTRLIPSIKQRYDYGVMIFILTFNLVAVSGMRAEEVIEIARERLSTIAMGFAICVFTSLFIFPMWAGDELHCLTASKFNSLASSIEGCLEEYFKEVDEKKENQSTSNSNGSKSVLYSKSKDESLANFARWEPWHGRFGFSYPWNKYLQIGDSLRELAASIISLKGCLQSLRQA
ncbi:PREDICTED: aluminum-activated malate transporter 14-like [Nelumbo nucifera]|uniref:Aluminum-activated malate transporter 14-like n=1 Tax=Nelumbo nucifera TaxID=4432 RepID=A0A1U8PY95_NELNU|nr:PREDICTED: aluminum-activated malate transporter 14-like [Nelumbo nucifera]